MTELYLIRHGDCEGAGAYIGRGSDVPLTSKGHGQIEALAAELKKRESNPPMIYSSPMVRAVESAEILGREWGLKPVPVPGLEESDFGNWEGMTYQQIKSESPDDLKKWLDDPWTMCPPGGETLAELEKRVLAALPAVEDSTVFMVSHRGPLILLLLHYLKLSREYFWNLRVDRGSVTKLKLYPRFCELSYLNLTAVP